MRMIAVVVCVAALAGCSQLDPDGAGEADPEVSVNEQGISNYYIRLYYSDASMTQQVGERSNVCTSLIQWGAKTQWVFIESGSCEYQPVDWPSSSHPPGASCDCCWDTNNNGSCEGSEGPFHLCSATFQCS